jgi:hypothetical protein
MEFSQEQKLYGEIVQKAWEDADFKKELVANPEGAIEKLTGFQLNIPTGKKLVVRDQTDESTVYINLPVKPDVDMELSYDQLEAAAGGGWKGATVGGLLGSVGGPWGALAGAYVGHKIEEALK